MRRIATGALLIGLTMTSCRPAGPAPEPAVPERAGGALPRTEPLVRIGLAIDTTEVVVGARGPLELSAPGMDAVRVEAGTNWSVTADAAGKLSARGANRTIGPVEGPLTVRPLQGDSLRIAGKPYRGAALIRAAGPGRLTAINTVELEEYLLGVVPHEMPPSAGIEPAKVQAVAARTYAIGNLGVRQRLGFDLYATVMDQVYGGIHAEDTVSTRAVRETAGEILAHGGAPILAYYHSTCGEQTAAIEDAWPWREPLPYLRSVSDRIPGTDRYYNQLSNRFHWTQSWTGEQLEAILATTLASYTGRQGTVPVRPIRSIELLGRNESGRVDSLSIVAAGQRYVVRGDSVRWILRPEPGRILNSALLYEVLATTTAGQVTGLEIRGGGWGHGVGMCQWGAIGRARAGQRYREILKTYYTAVEILDLY